MRIQLEVGANVIIRNDLIDGNRYTMMHNQQIRDAFVDNMESFRGKTATITSYTSSQKYTLDIDGGRFQWTDEMLIPLIG